MDTESLNKYNSYLQRLQEHVLDTLGMQTVLTKNCVTKMIKTLNINDLQPQPFFEAFGNKAVSSL